jgi:hypothetical protein
VNRYFIMDEKFDGVFYGSAEEPNHWAGSGAWELQDAYAWEADLNGVSAKMAGNPNFAIEFTPEPPLASIQGRRGVFFAQVGEEAGKRIDAAIAKARSGGGK